MFPSVFLRDGTHTGGLGISSKANSNRFYEGGDFQTEISMLPLLLFIIMNIHNILVLKRCKGL